MKIFAFVRTILLAGALSTFTHASAQDGGQTPIPNPAVPQWCGVKKGGGSICASSPDQACYLGNASFHPQAPESFVRAEFKNSTNYSCIIDSSTVRGKGYLFLGSTSVSLKCGRGFVRSAGACVPKAAEVPGQCSTGEVDHSKGNPIDPLSGIKIQDFSDFQTADGRLKFKRRYVSRSIGFNTNPRIGERVKGWSFADIPRIAFNTSGSLNRAFVYLGDHRTNYIDCDGSSCSTRRLTEAGLSAADIRIDLSDARFEKTFKTAQTTIPVVSRGDVKYIFKTIIYKGIPRGVITRAEYPDGYVINYQSRFHTEAIIEENPLNLSGYQNVSRYVVTGMTDSFGRSMSFEYGQNNWTGDSGEVRKLRYRNSEVEHIPTLGPLKAVTLPDLSTLTFTYDSATDLGKMWDVAERLIKATRIALDGTILSNEEYFYENEEFPFALTGLRDTAGIRYASWTYDRNGLANSSSHAGNLNRYDFNYDVDFGLVPALTKTEVSITNPLGRVTNYIPEYNGRYFEEVEGEPSPSCVGDIRRLSFSNGSRLLTDKEGRVTSFRFNNRGYVSQKITALGRPEAVTETTKWHPIWRLPIEKIMPGLTDRRTYDAVGRLTTRTLVDTSGEALSDQVWTYQYDGVNISSIDGPLEGSSDTIFFEWAGPNLTAVTNEVGHRTEILEHNAIGAPELIEDPNGVRTRVNYDAEHKVVSIVEDESGRNATTSIIYNSVDKITRITQPDGVWTRFIYDDARRLMGLENSGGESITLTRNLMGGITNQVVKGSQGETTFSMSQVLDEMNRIIAMRTIGESSGESVTNLAYDREDNLTGITDPRRNSWAQAFDGLDRLISETDPLGAETEYELDTNYDSRNPLSKVTDARNVETVYVRNGFGELVREVSFEAGTTEYVRDTRGLVTRMTDARGVITNYTYDAAGRLLSEDYENGDADDISYEYDLGEYGIGRLSAIVESFGRTAYTYDALGFMTSETREISTQSYMIRYTHDSAGNVLTMTYPSGRQVELARDTLSRVTDITMIQPDGAQTSLLNAVKYRPYGGMIQAQFGDGYLLDINYELAGRATEISRARSTGALMELAFTHDGAGDILAIEDRVRPDRSQQFSYDPVSRLISATGGYGAIDYGYNLGGDRTTRDWFGADGTIQASERYEYDAATARLLSVSTEDTGGNLTPIREFDYYASGQVSSDQRGVNGYLYGLNARGRVNSVTRNGETVALYEYDQSEQRIVKTANGQTIHYHYDLEGRLISETDGTSGEALREYVWLGLMPIAVIDLTEDAPDTACQEEIAALEAQIADRTTRLDKNAARIAELFSRIADKESRITRSATRITELEALSAEKTARINANATRITELGALIADKRGRIARNAARVTELEALIFDKQSRIDRNANRINELTLLIAADEAELSTLDPAIDATRFAQLTQRIGMRQERVTALTTRNAELTGQVTDHQTRITELTNRNAELTTGITAHEARITELTTRNTELAVSRDAHDTRAAELTTRNVELAAQNTTHETRIEELETRNFKLAEQRAQLEADLEEAQAGCDTVAGEGLYYLHADHLGRPQFATDPSGAVVWDMGGDVTPFGDSVNLAGAFAQQLMFPGQYADLETGGEGDDVTLSHNWHRTYDPTLGRYLQSDPIGLAGGLNRFAYVGGNPVGYVDPTGLEFLYNQSTGQLSYREDPAGCDMGCPPIIDLGTGYSGAPGFVNDPSNQYLKDLGVIPKGVYRIGSERRSKRTGRNFPLTPLPGTDLRGRHTFQIHGDKVGAPPRSSSNGCIIFNSRDRKKIWALATKNSDFTLIVY